MMNQEERERLCVKRSTGAKMLDVDVKTFDSIVHDHGIRPARIQRPGRKDLIRYRITDLEKIMHPV